MVFCQNSFESWIHIHALSVQVTKCSRRPVWNILRIIVSLLSPLIIIHVSIGGYIYISCSSRSFFISKTGESWEWLEYIKRISKLLSQTSSQILKLIYLPRKSFIYFFHDAWETWLSPYIGIMCIICKSGIDVHSLHIISKNVWDKF